MSKSARELAAKRAAELARRRTELTAGRPVTQEDIDLAWQRAEQSRQRAEEAHRSAAQRYEEAARVHDRVANFYGVGQVELVEAEPRREGRLMLHPEQR